jgi:mannosyltransferase OCH1-like enzyme
MLWDDAKVEAFLDEHYAWFVPWYRSYKADIYRADAVRYFLLYHYGGAYIDMDMECRRPLTPLLRNRVVLTNTPGRRDFFSNYFMMGEARHAFFAHCIDQLVPVHRSVWHLAKSYLGTMLVAGPFFLTRCYKSYVVDNSARERDIYTLPYPFLRRPGSADLRASDLGTVEPFAYHDFDSSWTNTHLRWDLARLALVVALLGAALYALIRSRR